MVEEHEEVRAALRAWLLASLPDLKLREARSMAEALESAGQASPDFVLMNVELPGPNGIEATRQLRRAAVRCPVVVMSFHDSAALRQAAEDAGADAFVSKRELPNALLPILDRFAR